MEEKRNGDLSQIEGLFDFIGKSPTGFHCVKNIEEQLIQEGFHKLEENQLWEPFSHKKYYVKRNDSSLIGFVLPPKTPKGFHSIAAHTDSPAFKVKSNPFMNVEDSYIRLNTEKYGGMIMSSWFDRPLSLAGRVFVEKKDHTLESRLVDFSRDCLVIPNVAIHMNREINQGYTYNPQKDTLPVFTENTDLQWRQVLAKELNIPEEKIVWEEMFVYVRQKGVLLGEENEWILCPRLDDLACVYTTLMALKNASPKSYISMAVFFDNEEVGSSTKQGADSDFFQEITNRIMEQYNLSYEEQKVWIRNSFLLSADNAHGLHPNYPEKADPTNRPKLNGGMVMKFHGGQKYTTDGYSAACFAQLCREAKVPFQTYCNRSDIAGGSTLGNILTTHVSIPSVDIGYAQLAMHSAVEMAGARDLSMGMKIFDCYYGK